MFHNILYYDSDSLALTMQDLIPQIFFSGYLFLLLLFMGISYVDLYHLKIWTIEFKRMTNGVRCSSSSVMVSESDYAWIWEKRTET